MKLRIITFLLFCLIFSITFLVLHLFKKPSQFLSIKGNITFVTEETELAKDNRKIKIIKLFHNDLGNINLSINFPKNYSNKPLPILFILGGIDTGLASTEYVSDIGNNILVGFEWPIRKKIAEKKPMLLKINDMYREINNIHKQVAVSLEWINNQTWSSNRISLLGFSIGAIVTPAVQRLIDYRKNMKINFTVLAYGGANLGLLINNNPFIKPFFLKPFFGWAFRLFFNQLDPKENLPFLSGKFLIINGNSDKLIPKESSKLIQRLTPAPKKIIILEGEHMGVGKEQEKLLKVIIYEIKKWLIENNAINYNKQS